MKTIEIDASKWKNWADFYKAVLPAIGAPDWHDGNVNALLGSMIWEDINAVKPPYTLQICSVAQLPAEVKTRLDWFSEVLSEGCEDFRSKRDTTSASNSSSSSNDLSWSGRT